MKDKVLLIKQCSKLEETFDEFQDCAISDLPFNKVVLRIINREEGSSVGYFVRAYFLNEVVK